MGFSSITTFSVYATGTRIEDFVELIELFYGTTAKVTMHESGVLALSFQSGFNRTESGVRVASRVCDMHLNSCTCWH